MVITLRSMLWTHSLRLEVPLKFAVGNRFTNSSFSMLKMSHSTKTAHIYHPFPLFPYKTVHSHLSQRPQVCLPKRNVMECHDITKAVPSQIKVDSSSVSMKISPRISLKKISHKTIETSSKARESLVTMWRKYGYTGVVVYLFIYIITLAGFFTTFFFDFINSENIIKYVEKIRFFHTISVKGATHLDSVWGQFAFAWLATKIVEPIRLCLTITITPRIVRLIQKMRSIPK